MNKLFFNLGNHPTISVAELAAVFSPNKSGQLLSNEFFVLDVPEETNAEDLIKNLGGTIKIGIIKEVLPGLDFNKILQATIKIIDSKKVDTKYHFGLSLHNHLKINGKKLGMEIKRHLKEQGKSCRWVSGKENVLSSVIVEQNKLVKSGVEIVIFKDTQTNEIYIGQTVVVQPFKELSRRDYGRPARDDFSGMLPPKLAQIIINLAQADKKEILLDPFCGSGTVLSEAMLMGYKNLIGSDISAKAINDTKKNLEWTRKKFQLSTYAKATADKRIINYELIKRDVRDLDKVLKPNSVRAIVTEPYLGPQRGQIDIKKTVRELEQLYTQAFKTFGQILKPSGRIVIILPIFYHNKKLNFINPDFNSFKIINPLPSHLQKNKLLGLTNRQTMIYKRPNQKVWREILVLEK